jgi:3D (Asp-Asp-Asp) domain-containing protein
MKPNINIKSFLIAMLLLNLSWGGFYLLGINEGHRHNTDEANGAETATERQILTMDVSAYCAGSCCCGKWADGLTASGKPATGFICAAPPEYPFGTEFVIDGVVWTCEDRGSVITGNKLDLLFEDKDGISGHQRALNFGRDDYEVTVIERVKR